MNVYDAIKIIDDEIATDTKSFHSDSELYNLRFSQRQAILSLLSYAKVTVFVLSVKDLINRIEKIKT